MSIHLHRCERTDGLVAGLAELLAVPPEDAFAPEVVAVPTRGIERFLSQTLALQLGVGPAGADGVCANVDFPAPAVLVERLIAAVAGISAQDDPWRPERAVWPLLATIDRSAGEPWCAPLSRHLGLAATDPDSTTARVSARTDRRFAVASLLAARFHSYGSQRPSLILEWAGGHNTDGGGGPLPQDLLWQPELWRRLRARIGTASPAERLEQACNSVRADPAIVDLPERISVFGPSRLPADQLGVLGALATHREVHLWLADASPTVWEALSGPGSFRPSSGEPSPVEPSSFEAGTPLARRRADDTSAGRVRHPLLRSMGRDARELRLRLRDQLGPLIGSDEHRPSDIPDDTLLARIQRQIRSDTDATDPAAEQEATNSPVPHEFVIGPADRSIQVHGCHGPARQAEVLRETVLHLLEGDSTLQPRDILVMCPDLTTFAPLISAVFSDPRPGARLPDLRVRMADRTPEQANDVLAALDALLDLAPGRMLLSEVLDLLARGPVRARFGFDESDVERIEVLAVGAGVRWGLDEDTRAAYLLTGLDTSTWQWGLDRMLLGAALSEDGLRMVGGVLPLDDVQSGDVSLVGRLAEAIARVRAFRDGAAGSHPLTHWSALLEDAIVGLMDARGRDSWQVPHALGAVAELNRSADDYRSDVPLSLSDIRWMLDEALAGRPTRTNFRSGGLTVCGLVPMRSVPHRVICLVGLDDGTFPRVLAPDGDDVLARDPRLGERDPRSEDRQQLLDSLMAATEYLVITYTNADDRTNEHRPPCVPLGELLDTLDATARTAEGRPARDHVVVKHPLQPFDPRNFSPGALGPRPLPMGELAFSHDEDGLAAARASLAPRSPQPGLITGPLPVEPVQELALTELVRFLGSPVTAFLRTRLGLPVSSKEAELEESLPIELDGLQKWAIGERVIGLLARNHTPEEVRAAELGRGCLPPGALTGPDLAGIGQAAASVADQLRTARTTDPRLVPIHLDLPSGRRITGAVPDAYGTQIVRGTFSKLKPKTQLQVWPELLAAAASQAPSAEPGSQWSAQVVGKDGAVQLSAPPAAGAVAVLDQLLDLYDAGMAAPLPLPTATAHAYAEKRHHRYRINTARAAAGSKWSRTYDRREIGECADLEQEMVWGPAAGLDVLLAEPPQTHETWYPEEPSRFGVLARRLWEPILQAGQSPAGTE